MLQTVPSLAIVDKICDVAGDGSLIDSVVIFDWALVADVDGADLNGLIVSIVVVNAAAVNGFINGPWSTVSWLLMIFDIITVVEARGSNEINMGKPYMRMWIWLCDSDP
ncbi:hypothetical protein NDU88_006573 [Pleurodeles waltl]|uniref:Uncharacterized protein n=1 Tax=Pleurodeles waltl TaxID=8319 RepID=A0AAV7X219_PLEWA|nr:hypothetical protein NDU88_006573 [Pleurodeles waltl]